mgnify:FL=1
MFGRFDAYILGRITRDITISKMQNGSSFCRFSVAVNKRKYVGKDGAEVTPPADYFDLVAYGPIADSIASHAKRGSVISANVQYAPYTNTTQKDGVTTVYQNVQWKVLAGYDIFETGRGNSGGDIGSQNEAAADSYGGGSNGYDYIPEETASPDYSEVPMTQQEANLIESELPF